ncbi:MAG: 3-hydroxyacyl-ACP dehydratase FabZ [Nitrospinae bacterium]|nr:3-hydroxyacyl-ACP dehydratase FabZ [Nitrospinota bacterium]
MTNSIVDIASAIPHRPPFLFVDRVVEMDDKRIVAEKYLSPDLDFFKGHYPHFPVMPGALTMESVIQAGAILLSMAAGAGDVSKGTPVLVRVRDAKFKKMIRPGDTITLEAELVERVANAFMMKGTAKVAGETAVSVQFTCAMAEVG